ncbi:MAG: molybdopterin-dependent oxidoreductase [Peptococcaceae bacterium]
MNSQLKKSVCPYDCPDTCGLVAEVKNNRVVKIGGDPAHPFTQGILCPKMIRYHDVVHSPARILQPLRRTGPKGSGQFTPVSWNEAIETITEQWASLIDSYGAESILPYSYAGTMGLVQRNCGEAFFHRLGASRLERTICSAAKGYGWSAVMGKTPAPDAAEAVDSDLIILWGTNALATNIHFYKLVQKAKKRGARVWVIETHETPTAKIADKLIIVRPGTDGALALGMMQVMEKKDLCDRDFIEEHVLGYEQFKAEILAQYSLERVSSLTGLAAGTIEELACTYAGARAPYISLGSGLSRYGNGAMTVRCIVCLPAVAGAWRKKGGGLFANTSTGGAFATGKITRADFGREDTRLINMNQLGHALNQITDPPVMGFYVYNSNPAIIAPDQNMVIKGLARKNLFTVVHERFMTDTALYADIILPATTSLEHSDIYRSYGHYFVQRAFPVIEPLGEAKSNWDVFAMLAKALGFTEEYFSYSAEEMIEQLIDQPTPWLAAVDREQLKAGRWVRLPVSPDYKLTYQTPSGKIEIYNERESEPLPGYLKPHGGEDEYWFMNAPSLYSLNGTFNELPELVKKKGVMLLFMNPRDALQNGFQDGQRVVAYNDRGQATFILKISLRAPEKVVFSEGILWTKDCPGQRSVNALTSQRLTDRAQGSTFYDTKVSVRAEN